MTHPNTGNKCEMGWGERRRDEPSVNEVQRLVGEQVEHRAAQLSSRQVKKQVLAGRLALHLCTITCKRSTAPPLPTTSSRLRLKGRVENTPSSLARGRSSNVCGGILCKKKKRKKIALFLFTKNIHTNCDIFLYRFSFCSSKSEGQLAVLPLASCQPHSHHPARSTHSSATAATRLVILNQQFPSWTNSRVHAKTRKRV